MEFLEQPPHLGESGTGSAGGGYRHQPPQPEAGLRRHRRREFLQLPRRGPGFGRLAADIHLQAYIKRRAGTRALLPQPPGDGGAGDGMRPIEMGGDFAGLVGLDGPDEMPDEGQIRERLHFAEGFLQVVLADVPDARRRGGADGGGGLGLGGRQHGNGGGVPPAGLRCAARAVADLCYIGWYQLVRHYRCPCSAELDYRQVSSFPLFRRERGNDGGRGSWKQWTSWNCSL